MNGLSFYKPRLWFVLIITISLFGCDKFEPKTKVRGAKITKSWTAHW